MFDGSGIDVEFGMALALGSFAVIALYLAQAGVRSIAEQMRKRKK